MSESNVDFFHASFADNPHEWKHIERLQRWGSLCDRINWCFGACFVYRSLCFLFCHEMYEGDTSFSRICSPYVRAFPSIRLALIIFMQQGHISIEFDVYRSMHISLL